MVEWDDFEEKTQHETLGIHIRTRDHDLQNIDPIKVLKLLDPVIPEVDGNNLVFHHFGHRNNLWRTQADPSRSSRYKAPFCNPCNPVTVAVVKVSQPFEPPFFH